MERDLRSSPEFTATLKLYEALLAPGGHIFNGRALCGHENVPHLHFIGQSFERGFEDGVSNRLCRVARSGGAVERLNERETRQIRLSPAGNELAVACAGDDAAADRIEIWSDGRRLKAQTVAGRIEQIDWAADGSRLLMVVAGTAARRPRRHPWRFCPEAEVERAGLDPGSPLRRRRRTVAHDLDLGWRGHTAPADGGALERVGSQLVRQRFDCGDIKRPSQRGQLVSGGSFPRRCNLWRCDDDV